MNWSILIFAYNEEGNIHFVLEKAIQFALDNQTGTTEIIVINDGSSDKTEQVALSFSSRFPLKVHSHSKNLGIGQALKSAYGLAKQDFICAIPADNQFDVDLIRKVHSFSDKEFFSFYRKQPYKSKFRLFLHRFNQRLNHFVFGLKLKDVNWIKVYHINQLQQISTELTSSLIESEICIKINLLGAQPIEHFSPYHPRISGESKGGSLKTIFQALKEILKLYLAIKRFKKGINDSK
jgi:glycosyltransferase involved in cell wall biosynthesis